ncbi:RrF2 family transcriptional regulator [Alicyclobacillus fodiniaquatilis]|uniref:RrF2 family transcriptional regulator n=1 Tax=Alicyclobacillus fodiniaquatilis TaxID=1661150 RepID=A0ABW4JSZ9_9BACL
MEFSQGTGYALHALTLLAKAQKGESTGIRNLASFLGVSESYLSKIMTKLKKGGIVRSSPGVSGGYELARPANEITFLDVIEVTEGRNHLYDCANFKENRHALFQGHHNDKAQSPRGNGCIIQQILHGAEETLNTWLSQHTIQSALTESLLAYPKEG